MKRHIAAAVVVNLALVGILALFVWWTAPPFNMLPPQVEKVCDCGEEFLDVRDDYRSLHDRHSRLVAVVTAIGQYATTCDEKNEQAFTNLETRIQQQITDLQEDVKKLKAEKKRGCSPWRQ